MEEKKELIEEKKNNPKPLIITIILLATLVLGLVGYIAYDKLYLEKKADKEISTSSLDEEKSSVKEELSLNDATVQKLFSIFSLNNGTYMTGLNDDNRVKLRIAYENIAETDFSEISCAIVGGLVIDTDSNSSNPVKDYRGICGSESAREGSEEYQKEYANAFSNNNLAELKRIVEKYYSTKSVASKIMKEKIEELFGSDYLYHPEDFGTWRDVEPNCFFMHYDEKNEVYAYYTAPCGGTGERYSEELVSAYKEGKKLYIEGKVSRTMVDSEIQKTIYQFQKDTKNGNYVFVKLTTE